MKAFILENVKLFVVPNGLVEDSLGQLYVQLWGHTDGSKVTASSANVDDHGIPILDENGKTIGLASPKLSEIPISVFADKWEGDAVTFMTEGWIEDMEHRRESAAFILKDAVLQQQGFRYERFGSFDEVLKRLIRNAKARNISA